MNFTILELTLLILAGLASGTYAKSEGASTVLAAAVGVAVAVVVVVLGR